jgi:hypothetical protein
VGASSKLEIFCLYSVSNRLAKLTAFGS